MSPSDLHRSSGHHEPIRVLVIDDSAVNRQNLIRILERSPLVEVIGSACDGEEALAKTLRLEPDLVTLDLEMPRMDGFTFLRFVMHQRPVPVLVVSSRSGQGDVFKALELGAVDFLAKPGGSEDPDLAGIERELIRKVHSIRELRIDKVRARLRAPMSPSPSLPTVARVVAIGASTGGPAALFDVFGSFDKPPDCSFLVAQHMPPGFTAGFASRLAEQTVFRAREALGRELLSPGEILVAPGGSHLLVERTPRGIETRLAPAVEADTYAPRVDRLLESAAKVLGPDLCSVILTGMGDDGRRGARAVAEAGGKVIAESEESAVVFGMPRQAILEGVVDEVLPLSAIPAAIGAGGAWTESRAASPRRPAPDLAGSMPRSPSGPTASRPPSSTTSESHTTHERPTGASAPEKERGGLGE